jgi:hypothetical protein
MGVDLSFGTNLSLAEEGRNGVKAETATNCMEPYMTKRTEVQYPENMKSKNLGNRRGRVGRHPVYVTRTNKLLSQVFSIFNSPYHFD